MNAGLCDWKSEGDEDHCAIAGMLDVFQDGCSGMGE